MAARRSVPTMARKSAFRIATSILTPTLIRPIRQPKCDGHHKFDGFLFLFTAVYRCAHLASVRGKSPGGRGNLGPSFGPKLSETSQNTATLDALAVVRNR